MTTDNQQGNTVWSVITSYTDTFGGRHTECEGIFSSKEKALAYIERSKHGWFYHDLNIDSFVVDSRCND